MREGGGCRSRSREEAGGGGGGRLECTEAQAPVGGVQGAPGEGREGPGGLGQPATPHTEGGGGGKMMAMKQYCVKSDRQTNKFK